MVACSAHPGAIAGWHCTQCPRDLCAACAAVSEHRVVVCVTCGTLVHPHLAPRAEVFPFRLTWKTALAELGSAAGIFQVGVVATVAHSLFTWGRWLWVLGCLLTAAWVLNLVRRSAVGIGTFGMPTWEDLQIVGVGALPRFVAAAAPIAVGAMVWTQLGLVAPPLSSPWPWLLAGSALLVVPPALVVSSIEGQGSATAWPWTLPHWLRTLGADLRPLQAAVLVVLGFSLLESQLPPINRALEDTRMLEHLFESWVPRLFTFAALGALGALGGRLVFTRAGELGHRRAEDDLVPRVDAQPTGRWVAPVKDPREVERELARKFAPIALEASADETAIARGAKDEAIAAYRAGTILAAQLELQPAVTLAQWLAGAGDFPGAANLLRVVTARVGGEPEALARAMVVLARLCAERLDAKAEATRLYEDVVRRFPDSAAAKFAAKQLS